MRLKIIPRDVTTRRRVVISPVSELRKHWRGYNWLGLRRPAPFAVMVEKNRRTLRICTVVQCNRKPPGVNCMTSYRYSGDLTVQYDVPVQPCGEEDNIVCVSTGKQNKNRGNYTLTSAAFAGVFLNKSNLVCYALRQRLA